MVLNVSNVGIGIYVYNSVVGKRGNLERTEEHQQPYLRFGIWSGSKKTGSGLTLC